MNYYLFLMALLLSSCASGKKDCWSDVESLYQRADKNSNLVIFVGAAGRTKEDAISLMQEEAPVLHRSGSNYLIDRTRYANSKNEYSETNYAGIWSLRDGKKLTATIVCQEDKHGSFYAYGLIDIDKIRDFLIKE